jgi:hypothetical protein
MIPVIPFVLIFSRFVLVINTTGLYPTCQPRLTGMSWKKYVIM